MKTYLRPLGLVYGADARILIAAGKAGALGGMAHIGFTLVEIITRGDGVAERRHDAFMAWKEHPLMRAICAARPDFAGLGMDQTRLMGIVNVTPDSFSDGGETLDAARAIAHGRAMADEGADVLDIGGESTRPGSDVVSDAEELKRIIPVVAALGTAHLVSADTRKAAVMGAALKAGAVIINDVSGLGFDAESAGVVAKAQCPVIVMHAQGAPKTMQLNPRYGDVALEVYDWLEACVNAAVEAGIARDRIMIDPGIGFGKTYQHNLVLMQQMALFHGLGLPLLIGLSRKGYVGALTGEKKAGDRAAGSLGGALQAVMLGAHMLRVHDMKATVHALKVFTASLDPDSVEF
jgi:dihydropteroate synthase